MSLDSLCDKTVTVERAEMSVSDAGAYEETFGIWRTWKVRIQPLTAAEMIKLGREATDIGIKIYGVPIALQESDEIVYGTRRFKILGIRNIDELDRLLTVDCVEVI